MMQCTSQTVLHVSNLTASNPQDAKVELSTFYANNGLEVSIIITIAHFVIERAGVSAARRQRHCSVNPNFEALDASLKIDSYFNLASFYTTFECT